jgi:type I restriction enzyme, R subunit
MTPCDSPAPASPLRRTDHGQKTKPPELVFQKHIADWLVREHKYAVLEQSEIADTEHFIAEDHLWAFPKATQADTLKKLEDNYGKLAASFIGDETIDKLSKRAMRP